MINCIDLFAGCGGLTEGFEKVGGIHSLALVEWEKAPCLTLANRLKTKWGYKNANEVVLYFDIQRSDELIHGWNGDELFAEKSGLKGLVQKREVDIIIGGPPCQAYSIAGRVRDKNGMHDDYRNFLFESYMEVVRAFQPKLFVFENVEGILSARPGGTPIIDRICRSFREAGYSTIANLRKHALLNAADFGVPQNRKRVIIIGVNESKLKGDSTFALHDLYNSIIPFFKVKKTTVEEALVDLPALMPLDSENRINGKKVSHDYNCQSVLNHIPRFHSERDQEIFAELAIDKMNGSVKYPDVASLIQLYFEKTGKQSKFHKYHVLDSKKQSNTIPAHLYKDGLRHIHPDPKQSRSITPREAARLQGFDDDFEFIGSMGEQYKMIGNAVPPVLAEKIAQAVKIFLNKYY
ncbi:DNA cytosine methyltransferase [bacterium AH-315-C07]|nr:DNA cytosine methyltransferase [bacterium AH-315-C07]